FHRLPRQRDVGVGARAVQQIIPEAVTRNDKGYLLINNDPILWTMLNAIKEQQSEIEKLQAANAALKARLDRLEQQQNDPKLRRKPGSKRLPTSSNTDR